MRYEIDTERILKRDMVRGTKFEHKSDARIKIMPYGTHYHEEAQEIKVLIGEISRRCIKKEVVGEFDKALVLENIKKKIVGNKKEELITFIEELYFDKQGHLELFHPKAFVYLEDALKGKKDQERIGKYLYDVLFKDIPQEKIDYVFNQGGDLMVQLMVSALPEQKDMADDETNYINYAPLVKKVFEEDMEFLLKDHKRFIKCFDKLIEYYYFFYTSQAAMKLNQRQRADLESITPIYFRLVGEVGGSNRPLYLKGYRQLKEAIEVLFANVMLVQFLSYNKLDEDEVIENIPQWYKKYIENATPEENEAIAEKLRQFTEEYRATVEKQFDWSGGDLIYRLEDTPVDRALLDLFGSIAYQFQKSTSRKSAAEKYKLWFTQYCAKHYLESRGSLGHILTAQEEDIIFMTGICIKDEEKMRLSDLFEEFERRGLFFDDISKEKIVAIYEKSNLLEKKSDSGDAQYVRAIL